MSVFSHFSIKLVLWLKCQGDKDHSFLLRVDRTGKCPLGGSTTQEISGPASPATPSPARRELPGPCRPPRSFSSSAQGLRWLVR